MVLLLSACGGKEPAPPTPDDPTPVNPPTPPAPEKDTQAPAISVKASQVNVIAGAVATLGSGELKL